MVCFVFKLVPKKIPDNFEAVTLHNVGKVNTYAQHMLLFYFHSEWEMFGFSLFTPEKERTNSIICFFFFFGTSSLGWPNYFTSEFTHTFVLDNVVWPRLHAVFSASLRIHLAANSLINYKMMDGLEESQTSSSCGSWPRVSSLFSQRAC